MQSAKQLFRTIQIIHYALIMVPVIFGAVIYYLSMENSLGDLDSMVLLYLPVLVLVAALPVSEVIFRQTIQSRLKADADLVQKLSIYQVANMVRMSMIEFAAIFACVVCYVTGSLYNLVVLGGAVLVFYMKAPTTFALQQALGLSQEEKNQLES